MAEALQTGRVLRFTLFYVAALLLWESLVRLLHVPDWLIPAPSQILAVITDKNSIMLSHTLVTLKETLLGFILALALGVACAIAIVHFPLVRDTLYPSLIMFNSFPKVAIAPLFVVWIGVGIESKIANAFLTAIFPIVLNTILGLTNMDPELLELVCFDNHNNEVRLVPLEPAGRAQRADRH